MPLDYQHKWQGLIISPLLCPMSLDLPDEKDQISSSDGHVTNFTCRKLCKDFTAVSTTWLVSSLKIWALL